MSIRLGPFILDAVLGRGGMGTVWSADVADGDARVAVKTLTAAAAREAAYVRELHTEVRAMAAMTHPNIALVLDHGVTPPEGAGDLPGGSPWLAMELASGGSLASARPASWPELREALLAVLAGLAHAHARGIIHRDIKPANVLLCTQADLRPGWKLADFGIARAAGSEADDKVRGTPRYMAPEQFRGRWRDQGPWTDLYAVGCLAWELATGATPFDGDWVAQRSAHLQREPGGFVPTVPVPTGFEEWARGLLDKPISTRVARAADAMRALLALGDEASAPGELGALPLVTSDTWSTGVLDDLSAEWTATDVVAKSAQTAVTLPADWRPLRPVEPTIHLRGVGLGLFMLRTSRMVGREAERDALWARLGEVVTEGRGQAVVLHGATGVGKSRIALWLAHRAHEVGCTELPLVAHAREDFDDDSALARMVLQALGADGLEPRAVQQRLRRHLVRSGEADDARFQDCIRALGASDEAAPTAAEQRTALAWLIGVLARQRPLIVWLDDVQWSESALHFVTALLDRQTSEPAPILIVATVRREALATRDLAQRMLAKVERRADAHHIDLDRMDTGQMVQLVRDLLGVDGVLAHHVSLRADGNPLYATQLVGSWAHKGLLERGPGGFVLPDGAEHTLPDDLAQVWLERLRGVSRRWPGSWRAAAQLAGLIGSEFSVREWGEAAEFAELHSARSALDELLSEGLLWPADRRRTRLVFVHGMIRDALVQQAVDESRAPTLHRAIARVLATYDDEDRNERLGRHLLGGECFEAALEPLWQASERRRRRGQYGLADALAADHERALDAAAIGPHDERRITTWRTRAEYARMNGDGEGALRFAQRAAGACTLEQGALRAAAIRVGGQALFRLGRREESLERFEHAMKLAVAAGDQPLIGRVHTSLAYLLPVMGDRRGGERHARAALEILQSIGGDYTALGNAWTALTTILITEDRLDEAAHTADAALAVYQEAGNRAGIAMVANDRGDLLRRRGKHDEAERSYALSAATYAATGAMQQHIAELNLAIVNLELGRWARARPRLQRCAREFRAHRWHYVEAAAECGLAAIALAEGGAEQWDAHIARAGELWAAGGLDVDFARIAELAARVAETHDPTRAGAAWKLAADQWAGLDKTEEAAAALARVR